MGAKKKVRVRPQKLAKLLLKEKNTSRCSTLKIVLTILVLLATAFLLTMFVLKSENDVDSRIYDVGVILKQNVKLSLELVEQQFGLEEFLHEDQLVEYIKTAMRPIQERVSSLIIHTAQYEKLPHIPGGPKHFITTTLRELDYIQKKYMKEVGLQILAYLKNRVIEAQNLLRRSNNDVESRQVIDSSITNSAIQALLMNEGIYLAPRSTPATEIMEMSLGNYEYLDIVRAHLELANIFPAYQNSFTQISKHAEKFYPLHPERWVNWDPKDFPNDQELQDLFNTYHAEKQKLRIVVEKNKDKYPLLVVHSIQALKTIKQSVEKLANYERSAKLPYLKLNGLIMSDIKKLRIRVENLKFNYVKKQYKD